MKKLLLAVSVFVLASCTASISIKAQEFNGDPGAQPLPEAAPLSPNKNKAPGTFSECKKLPYRLSPNS